MEDRMPVDLGERGRYRRIGDFEAAALECGDPALFFPLSGFDARENPVGWIDRRGMVPLSKAGEISAVHAMEILEQLVYGLYEDMDLCLLPENCLLGMEDVYADTVTWRVRAVFRPAVPPEGTVDPAASIRRKVSAVASGMLKVSEIRARGYIERALRLLAREDLSLDRTIRELEALKQRAFRLSSPEGAKLDFGNVFV